MEIPGRQALVSCINQRCEVILIVYVINDQKISVSQGTTVVLHIYTDIEEFINQNV